jgi:hypothetical protein
VRWPVTRRERFGGARVSARAGLDAAFAFGAARAPVTAPAFRRLAGQAPRRSRGLLGSPVAWTPPLRPAEFRVRRLVPRRTVWLALASCLHRARRLGARTVAPFQRVPAFRLWSLHPSRPAGGFGQWLSGRLSQPPQRLTRRCSERLRAVTACAARHADPPTTDPLTAPSATQPTLAAFARTGCASPPPSLSLRSLGAASRLV